MGFMLAGFGLLNLFIAIVLFQKVSVQYACSSSICSSNMSFCICVQVCLTQQDHQQTLCVREH